MGETLWSYERVWSFGKYKQANPKSAMRNLLSAELMSKLSGFMSSKILFNKNARNN